MKMFAKFTRVMKVRLSDSIPSFKILKHVRSHGSHDGMLEMVLIRSYKEKKFNSTKYSMDDMDIIGLIESLMYCIPILKLSL